MPLSLTKSSSFSSFSTARKTTQKIVPIPSEISGRSGRSCFWGSEKVLLVRWEVITCYGHPHSLSDSFAQLYMFLSRIWPEGH
ncbi:unnamed protein product [Prunus armeniaca]